MTDTLIEFRDLNGWSCSTCPHCGALNRDWLTEEGPDLVEYEACPMCSEDAADEEAEW